MNEIKSNDTRFASNVARTTVHLGVWTAAWLLSMALASFGPKFLWMENNLISLLAIVFNVAIGIGMILANKRHLLSLDELHQRVQLEAMGWALGVGVVVGLGYSMLDVVNLIRFDAEISHLVVIMGLTYLGTLVAGLRRYL